jgi:hypothetical protein
MSHLRDDTLVVEFMMDRNRFDAPDEKIICWISLDLVHSVMISSGLTFLCRMTRVPVPARDPLS